MSRFTTSSIGVAARVNPPDRGLVGDTRLWRRKGVRASSASCARGPLNSTCPSCPSGYALEEH